MPIRHSSLSLYSILPVIAIVAGCAAPVVVVQPAPRFTWGQSVDFGGMHFDVTSAEAQKSFTNFVHQRTYAGDTFMIVDVTMTNKSGIPLESNFQPRFRLIDSVGATYELDQINTMKINMEKPGRMSAGQTVNPNVKIRQQLVFEAPEQKYNLQVIMPNSAKVGFNGSITTTGPYFLFDISPPTL